MPDLAATLPGRLADAAAGSVGTKVAYPIGLRRLVVVRTTPLSPAMVRVTLGGPEITGFCSHVAEEPVRFVLPDDGGVLRLPERDGEVLRWSRPTGIVSREYSVRRWDAEAQELDVDVVLHAGGRASEWARGAVPGDAIHLAGPPGGFVVPDRYTHHLFAGDLTALPQIGRYLEHLPATARGTAVIEVADTTEELDLVAPPGVDVRWVHRGAGVPPGLGGALERAVREVGVAAPGETFVWLAGEAGALKPLRRWLRGSGVAPGDMRVTGYWKRGVQDFDDD